MKILAIILFSYLTLSTIGFICLLLFKRKVFLAEEKPIYYLPIVIGAFLSLTYVLYFGFKELFVLIPDSWGDYNEDGNWSSLKSSIAIVFSLITSFYFFYLIAQVDTKEEMIQKLKKQRKQNEEN